MSRLLSNNKPATSGIVRRWPIAGSAIAAAIVALASPAVRAAPSADTVIANIDLAKPFAARSEWRLIATQGPQVTDPIFGEGTVPGSVVLCLEKSSAGPCDPGIAAMPQTPAGVTSGWDAHYLDVSKVVYPRGPSAPPLLMLRTASLHSGDGDQAVFTQLFAYRRASDRFAQIYGHLTGRNNNQEVRFIEAAGGQYRLGRTDRRQALQVLGFGQQAHLELHLWAGPALPQRDALRRRKPPGRDRLGDAEHREPAWSVAARLTNAASRWSVSETATDRHGALVQLSRVAAPDLE
ncbi:MAG TPA: hypothetical protein VN805_05355 [Caulobacteraceae bacterium]|nr:hypothetical protein [Caulobacteraceae bacterium]